MERRAHLMYLLAASASSYTNTVPIKEEFGGGALLRITRTSLS
jgi:hypothetical protein